jgi:hypothetical protein
MRINSRSQKSYLNPSEDKALSDLRSSTRPHLLKVPPPQHYHAEEDPAPDMWTLGKQTTSKWQ